MGSASSQVVELAKTVRALGGDSQGQEFDTFAAIQMRMIAPNDPGWNQSNPKYVALFKRVQQDLKHDTEPALQVSTAEGVRQLADTFQSNLATTDVGQLLAFYRSGRGQRYIAFQQRVSAIQAQGITQLTAGLSGAAASATPSDVPSQELLKARRRVLDDSWMSLLIPDAMGSRSGTSGNAAQPDTKSFFSAILDIVARTQGLQIDAIEREYAADFPGFEAFHESPAARSLLAAMRAGMQRRASAQSPDPLQAALQHSVAEHSASWKAAYEAARSSTPSLRGNNQDNLGPLVAMGQIAAALEAQKPSVLKPGDADYPEELGRPTQTIPLIVSGPDGADMRFQTTYVSDAKLCGHQVGFGGYMAYTLQFPVILTKSGDSYRGSIALDRFKPGKCGWRFSSVGYAMGDGVQNALALPANHDDPGVPKREFWCYRVTYENKPLHACEDLALLRWSNAMRAVSREFLAQFSHQQQSDVPIIKVTSQTREIDVVLHDLNAVPGALIPVGDRDEQIARAQADRTAQQRTPEYKAYKCEDEEKLEWIKSHNKPLPDEATQRAAYEAIHGKCRAEFGLPPSPLGS
jgi:hypothetical protein